LVWPHRATILAPLSGWSRSLMLIAFWSLAGKILIQTAVVIPFIAKAAYTIRNYVIGFIHLVLLGAMSSLIISLALHHGMLTRNNRITRIGLAVFVTGLLGSEALLFLQGTLLWAAVGFLPNYYEAIFAVSALIPVGAALVGLGEIQARGS